MDGWPSCEHDVPALFDLERSRLLAQLDGLPPNGWAAPTPCPGWSVLDLACHLLGDDLGWLARHRDGYEGTRPPAGTSGEGFARWLDHLQDGWVQAARRLSPRLVVDLLTWTGPQVVSGLESQEPDAVTAHVDWAGDGEVPVWLDHLRELSEQWIHRQQLLEALEAPSDLRADLAGPVLDGVRWAWPHALRDVTAAAGDRVTITVSGPVTRAWHLVAGAGGWSFAPAGGPAVVTLDLTTEQAWRLLSHNLDPIARRYLRPAGDPAVVRALLGARGVIISRS